MSKPSERPAARSPAARSPAARPGRGTVAIIVYVVLAAVAVPWYWRPFFPEPATRIVLGMPLWSGVSVIASALVSLYTALLFLRPWPGEDQPAEAEDGP